jgi:hypothetical protein
MVGVIRLPKATCNQKPAAEFIELRSCVINADSPRFTELPASSVWIASDPPGFAEPPLAGEESDEIRSAEPAEPLVRPKQP